MNESLRPEIWVYTCKVDHESVIIADAHPKICPCGLPLRKVEWAAAPRTMAAAFGDAQFICETHGFRGPQGKRCPSCYVKLHDCKLDLPFSEHGSAITSCYEDVNGKFWVSNNEYASQVNYCPMCGTKAPEPAQNKPDRCQGCGVTEPGNDDMPLRWMRGSQKWVCDNCW